MSNLINRTELFNELSRVPISQYAVDERTMIYNKINEMPTAETTGDLDDAIQEYIKSGLMELDDLRPKGHWEYEKINSYSERTYCSECGSHAPFAYVHDDHYGRLAHGEIRKTKYCPNCGAYMRGDNND